MSSQLIVLLHLTMAHDECCQSKEPCRTALLHAENIMSYYNIGVHGWHPLQIDRCSIGRIALQQGALQTDPARMSNASTADTPSQDGPVKAAVMGCNEGTCIHAHTAYATFEAFDH